MRILILGGDGYLGWPTAMQLSARGHEVMIVDNYLRREMAQDNDAMPLVPHYPMSQRAAKWKEISGHSVDYECSDLSVWENVANLFSEYKPEAVLHYAEQPSAPYSMLNRRTALFTINNNLNVTANVIFAVKEFCPDAHIVKLGTMGEYGTPNIDIEEGWLNIMHHGREDRFLYPRQAGSLYHTTKIMDTDLLWFYVRTWGLKVTDLMQGPVYGIFTDENKGHDNLLPHFAYDEIFGTVLNRFIVQAIAGRPLTVYGNGGQTRGYINLKDTLQCVRLSIENPPEAGKMRIFNQFTETFTVSELAHKVKLAAATIGIPVAIENCENPRIELEEHYYNPAHTGLTDLGLEPNLLTTEELVEMLLYVDNKKDFIIPSQITKNIKWK